jgi:23S rRNA (adenine2503-C2)-methyltransferase
MTERIGQAGAARRFHPAAFGRRLWPGLSSLSLLANSPSVWALLPEELAALSGTRSAQHVFRSLQRPWLWHGGAPGLTGARRAALGGQRGLSLPRIAESHASSDGSVKLALEYEDGRRVEAVHMPRAVGLGRVTLCVSSQVGCGMACAFCATGKMGLRAQLSAAEIVAQVLVSMAALGPRHPSELSLVFMGMGEPLQNLDAVLRAVRVLCEPAGLGLPPRRITVSTSGIVPAIAELSAAEPRPLLAVSLNATDDAVRRQLMPIAQRWSLDALRAALCAYPLRPRERITVEYVLLAGVNDAPADARRLADFCAPFPHNINLIPFNEHPGAPYRAPSEARIDEFVSALAGRRRCLVTVRRSRGRDVQAACGQLVLGRAPRPAPISSHAL